jgi:hypothetical protein
LIEIIVEDSDWDAQLPAGLLWLLQQLWVILCFEESLLKLKAQDCVHGPCITASRVGDGVGWGKRTRCGQAGGGHTVNTRVDFLQETFADICPIQLTQMRRRILQPSVPDGQTSLCFASVIAVTEPWMAYWFNEKSDRTTLVRSA